MKVWKVAYRFRKHEHDVAWAMTKVGAENLAFDLNNERDDDSPPPIITEVEIPTDLDGLVAWLNENVEVQAE